MKKCLAYILLWKPEIKNVFQAREKAFQMLVKTGSLNKEEATGVGRQYLVEDGEDGLMYCLPRKMYHKGDVTQQRLVLVSGRSEAGRALVADLHVHCSGVGREIAKMFSAGVFITRHRHLFSYSFRVLFAGGCVKDRLQRRLDLLFNWRQQEDFQE